MVKETIRMSTLFMNGVSQIFNEISPVFYNDYVAGVKVLAYSIVFEEEFDVDRPFVYTIVKTSLNEETGVREMIPLFVGHIVNPEY